MKISATTKSIIHLESYICYGKLELITSQTRYCRSLLQGNAASYHFLLPTWQCQFGLVLVQFSAKTGHCPLPTTGCTNLLFVDKLQKYKQWKLLNTMVTRDTKEPCMNERLDHCHSKPCSNIKQLLICYLIYHGQTSMQ